MSGFFDSLDENRRRRDTVLCVGLDPRIERIPDEVRSRTDGTVEQILYRFVTEVLEVVADQAACVKPQIAFFEAHGLAGLRAYARILREARRYGLPVIADAKRGDIGSTAAAYAAGHLEPGGDFEVDAITLNPYLGRDALQPFVDTAVREGKGLYVLVRTSNPGARDLQELTVDGRRLFEHTADLVRELGRNAPRGDVGLPCVGAVVGATAPEALRALREALPDCGFLVPGYGAQGATASDVAAGRRADGSGMVVNASRSVIHPAVEEGSWRDAVAAAARRAREELHAAISGR
jgi:orotidine-5'-phosphate decarboxylase